MASTIAEAVLVVAQQVQPLRTLAPQAVELTHGKLELFLVHLAELLGHAVATSGRRLDTHMVERTVTTSLLEETMATWALEEAHKALTRMTTHTTPNMERHERFSAAELVFPPMQVRAILLNTGRIDPSDDAVVFVAAIAEYVCADLLQAAGNHAAAMARNDDAITLSDVVHTIAGDEELSKLFFVVSTSSESSVSKRKGLNPAAFSSEPRPSAVLHLPSEKSSAMKIETRPSTLTAEQQTALSQGTLPAVAFRFSAADFTERFQTPSNPNSPRPSAASIARDMMFSGESGTNDHEPWDTSVSWQLPGVTPSPSQPALPSSPSATTLGRSISRRSISLTFSEEQGSLSPKSSTGNVLEKLRELSATHARTKTPIDNKYGNTISHLIIAWEKKSKTKLLDEGATSVLVKVLLPDQTTTKVEIAATRTTNDLLHYVVNKRGMAMSEYIICAIDMSTRNPGPALDGSATIESLGLKEVALVRKDLKPIAAQVGEVTRTLYITEGGKDVLVLEVIEDRTQVSAGTIEKLLERMADENRQDNKYVDCVLLTHRFFMEATNLFEHLYARFKIQCPQQASQEAVKYFNDWQIHIQRRVINVVRWWVDNYWQDFDSDVNLLDYLLEFIDELRANTFTEEARQLEEAMVVQLKRHSTVRPMPAPCDSVMSLLLTFDARVIATQLTLWDFDLFQSIEPVEYTNQILQKSTDLYRNLDIFVKRFEMESFWVATELCVEPDLSRRVVILEMLIRIAKHCRDSNNFFSTFAIVGGLNLAPVLKLKRTWEELPSKTVETWKELQTLLSPYQNTKNYRDKMLQSRPPIIPVLPVYMKDLLFTHDGNRTFVNKLVNFRKCRMISNLVRQMIALKAVAYPHEKCEPELLDYIRSPICIADISRLSKLSASHELA